MSEGPHDLDVSVHFNAYETTSNPMGTECLYYSQVDLAGRVADAISAASGLIDRGPKKRTDLKFLNSTLAPAVLVETAFVDSSADADIYRSHFDAICRAIAQAISGREIGDVPPTEPPVEPIPPEPEPGPEPQVPTVEIRTTGRVDIYVNGALVTEWDEWNENITATEFGGSGDEQDSAYGGRVDGDELGVSFPYKWRDKPPPRVIVEGPSGQVEAPVVDVGPWNTDDPNYVLEGQRPLAETQYAEGTTAQMAWCRLTAPASI
jgi:hypothetical protein